MQDINHTEKSFVPAVLKKPAVQKRVDVSYKKNVATCNNKSEIDIMQDYMKDLWFELSKKDPALVFPKLNSKYSYEDQAIKMFASSTARISSIMDAIRSLKSKHVWAGPCLKNLQAWAVISRENDAASSYKYILSYKIVKSMLDGIGQQVVDGNEKTHRDCGLFPVVKKTEVVVNKYKPRIDNKQPKNIHENVGHLLKPSFHNNENARIRAPKYSHRATHKPNDVKKSWANNRINKGANNAFTQIQAETINGKQLFTAELLNTVPDAVLSANGWKESEINGTKSRNKSEPMSRAAMKELGYYGYDSGNAGSFYGSGSFGLVKHARITMPGTNKKEWCVAKKIKITTQKILIKRSTKLVYKSSQVLGQKYLVFLIQLIKKGSVSVLFLWKNQGYGWLRFYLRSG